MRFPSLLHAAFLAAFVIQVPFLVQAQTPPPDPARPILFVHGICGGRETAGDLDPFAPIRDYLAGHFPEYANPTSFTLYSEGTNTYLWPSGNDVRVAYIPPDTKFFSINFYAPIIFNTDNHFNHNDVANTSILNQATQLATVVRAIAAITHIKDVIVIAHSMGGLVTRTYIETLASQTLCGDVNYCGSGTSCAPGSVAYTDDIAALITLDTPHGGAIRGECGLDPWGFICAVTDNLNRVEMFPESVLLRALNYLYPLCNAQSAHDFPVAFRLTAIRSYYGTSYDDGCPASLCSFAPASEFWDGVVFDREQSITLNINPSKLTPQLTDMTNQVAVSLCPDDCFPGIGPLTPAHLLDCLAPLAQTNARISQAVEPVIQGQFSTIEVRATQVGTLFGGRPTYEIEGPPGAPVNGVHTLPQSGSEVFSDLPVGTYTVSYLSGGPCAAPPSSISPSAVQEIRAGQWSLTFDMQFDSAAALNVSWTTQPPASIAAGQEFTIAWTRCGGADHVNVHWSPTDPKAAGCCIGPAGSTNDSTLSPTTSPAPLVAPSLNANGTQISAPPTVKYVVHVLDSGTGNSTYSSVASVIVNPPTSPLPTTVTGSPSSITSMSAALGGSVNPNGFGTYIYFEWTTNSNFANPIASPQQYVGAGGVSLPVSANISSLSPSTVYYYRLVATNAGGTARGAILNFTTTAGVAAPTVTTGAASGVSANAATLAGTVNPNGTDTTIHFEWSTDPTLSSFLSSPLQGVGPGLSTVPVSANISGLTGSTTYYYRLVATNTGGTARGAIASFTTSVQSPIVVFLLDRYSIDFGTVPVGNSQSGVLTITNAPYSTGTLTGNVGSPATPFSIVVGGGGFTLAPGQVRNIAVLFDPPEGGGTFSGGFQITHNAAGSPANISLSGTGEVLTVGIIISPSVIEFDNIPAGGSATQDLTLTNPAGSTGNLNGTVSGLTSPFDFCCNPNFAIGPGGSWPVHVRFLPTAQGDFADTLTLTHNAAGSPTTVPVIGRTAITKLVVSPLAVNFGNARVGEFVDQTVTITNALDSTATVSGDILSSDYGNPQSFVLVSGLTGFNLAPGDSTSLILRFAPQFSGSFSGTLVVKPHDYGPITSVPLTGTNDTSDPNLFAEVATGIPGLSYGAIAWGDYDNDSDLDLAVAGASGAAKIARIYRNDNGSTFSDIGASLTGVSASAVAWGDHDNDGDLDLVVAGWTGSMRETHLYRNDGGSFTESGAVLTGASGGGLAWGDYDSDGDLDLAVNGYTNDQTPLPFTRIYRNDGDGAFTDTNTPLMGLAPGAVAWGDLDSDSDLDLVVTGRAEGVATTKIYRNDGDSAFTDMSAPLSGVSDGGVSVADFDNDGDLDILLTGNSATGRSARIYRNDADQFVEAASLIGVDGSAAWCDYDNDGDPDAIVTGLDAVLGGTSTKVYRNDGGGGFVDIGAWLAGAAVGALACGDYDDDGRVDLVVAGGQFPETMKLYRNNTSDANTPPAAPNGLASLVRGNSAILTWDGSDDGQTPAAGLSYNLRVGTQSGGSEIVSPMSAVPTGDRRLPRLGNASEGRGWNIGDLPIGTYYWGVQAIDSAFAGSSFASEQSFVVTSCLDFDGDGYGSPGDPACAAGTSMDCNDGNGGVFPGALESCDDVDNDCDLVADGFATVCGLGECASAGSCVAGVDSCTPGVPSAESCDGLDNDCDGAIPAAESDADGDGLRTCAGDCDDTNVSTYPGAIEVNDGQDNQCPGDPGYGVVDEVSGAAGFTDPTDATRFCWPAQIAATSYQVVGSTQSVFGGSCGQGTTGQQCVSIPNLPPSRTAYFFLVRAAGPLVGSWGQRSSGAERTVPCIP